ncbi:hypothetical protein HPB48_004607 [Haemaphysalis longicornis]|uniref:Uncharacterized protein n=1 Tax=Haemaphysalis longicornis TaxID=44386 RepID=A0A9J6FHN0_HAELO|nr:hypothetical protein HPB48_004607 [Haemaphysalis longicornis]
MEPSPPPTSELPRRQTAELLFRAPYGAAESGRDSGDDSLGRSHHVEDAVKTQFQLKRQTKTSLTRRKLFKAVCSLVVPGPFKALREDLVWTVPLLRGRKLSPLLPEVREFAEQLLAVGLAKKLEVEPFSKPDGIVEKVEHHGARKVQQLDYFTTVGGHLQRPGGCVFTVVVVLATVYAHGRLLCVFKESSGPAWSRCGFLAVLQSA